MGATKFVALMVSKEHVNPIWTEISRTVGSDIGRHDGGIRENEALRRHTAL